MEPIDILILSNGPGEVATWVRPVVKALRDLAPDAEQVRISVVLSPCPNANGLEAAIARSYPEVDRVQGVEHFFPFLLWGQTAERWDWRRRGVVLFLGGDQIYPVIIGKRLGYKTVIYAEWDARWHRWVDQFAVMKPDIVEATPSQYRHKVQVVGDLMADISTSEATLRPVVEALGLDPSDELIGLLPGSKNDKLPLGVPLTLAVAERVHAVRPQTRFVIPVAPMLALDTLASYADPDQNPAFHLIESVTADLILPPEGSTDLPKFRTPSGLEIPLWQTHPTYDLLARCQLCLTTIGANTAQLGSLAVPMLVLLPTQKMDIMRSWDGIPGILANLPLVGSPFARLINWLALKQIFKEGRLFAWPNLWAGREIVPELIGRLTPQYLADLVLDYLEHPDKLTAMQAELRSVRGKAGAAAQVAEIVLSTVDYRVSRAALQS